MLMSATPADRELRGSTGHKCYVWLVTANEQHNWIINAETFRQEDDDNQRLLDGRHLVESFTCHYYQQRYLHLPQDKLRSVGGVKHTKQLSLIEVEIHTIK